MRQENVLYIVVNDYPYGYGEPFIEEELNELSKKFNKICLIITDKINLNNLTQKFNIPENIELKFYIPENNFRSKLNIIKFILSTSVITDELKLIRNSYKLPFTFFTLKLLLSYIYQGIQFQEYLNKLITSENRHISSYYFYTYWCTYYTFGLALFKKNKGEIKAITRAHGWDLYMYRHSPAYLPFRQFMIQTLDRTFTISENGKKYLLENIPNIKEEKIKVNLLGTTINNKPLAKSKGTKINILSIAFISQVKRIDLLINAISLINDFELEWHHIGSGLDANSIESLASTLLGKKRNVSYKFYGNLPKQEVYNHLRKINFNLFINTSYSEGLPVSIMEAMSFGIPAIATDVGGNKEIVEDKVNGILLSPNPNPEEVAKAIKFIYDLEPNQYELYCKNAYDTWNKKFNNELNNKLFINDIFSIDKELYKVCSRCIIDNIDYPEISFNQAGICNVCQRYDEVSDLFNQQAVNKNKTLIKILSKIKEKGKNNEYDCIIGLSGGVDSSYLAYQAKKLGLRPILVHLDNGWNSELATKNIETIVKKLDLDLYSYVLNWVEFKDLQLSFIKASVIDIEVLTDHAIYAVLHHFAAKNKIKYILSGENIVTEGRMPHTWVHLKNDLINIKDIHKKFGKVKMKTFPTLGYIKLLYYQKIIGITTIPLLDYMDYTKNEAKKIIRDELEWRDYGGKHYESVFTRFYQSYILPTKFHVDKRKSHYSTLICSGQLTRDEAFELMKLPVYDNEKLMEDKEYVLKKLSLTKTEFDEMMKQPIKKHTDYKSIANYFNLYISIKQFIKKLK